MKLSEKLQEMKVKAGFMFVVDLLCVHLSVKAVD